MDHPLRKDSTASPGSSGKVQPGEHRSPCPALNALANGGHIPHDGKVTKPELVSALEAVLGVSRSVGSVLANAAFDKLGKPGSNGEQVLDLADLSLHGFIEHDASLTRRDTKNGDAAELVPALVDQLMALSKDGKTLTLEDLAVAHQLRMAQSSEGGHSVPLKAGVLGTLEAALLYMVLARDGRIALSDLAEFLREERVPSHFAPRKVDWFAILRKAAEIAVMGNVPSFDAAKRAQEAAQQIVEPDASRCPVAHSQVGRED